MRAIPIIIMTLAFVFIAEQFLGLLADRIAKERYMENCRSRVTIERKQCQDVVEM